MMKKTFQSLELTKKLRHIHATLFRFMFVKTTKDFKILPLVYKSLNSLAQRYIKDLLLLLLLHFELPCFGNGAAQINLTLTCWQSMQ